MQFLYQKPSIHKGLNSSKGTKLIAFLGCFGFSFKASVSIDYFAEILNDFISILSPHGLYQCWLLFHPTSHCHSLVRLKTKGSLLHFLEF